MNDLGWKRDKTPYIVFPCIKCHQYMYAKDSQKSKKCLRCGQSHKISEIKDNVEIVKGMSRAVKIVKKRQNELALIELGSLPQFKSLNDFQITMPMIGNDEVIDMRLFENDYLLKFSKILKEISEMYKEFPLYIIEMMAEKYNIPKLELKLIMNLFIRQGILIRLNSHFYKIRIE
ncbi:MAG: DUF1922 domain-containing protein [Candidatus Odinarchaeota archaeon]